MYPNSMYFGLNVSIGTTLRPKYMLFGYMERPCPELVVQNAKRCMRTAGSTALQYLPPSPDGGRVWVSLLEPGQTVLRLRRLLATWIPPGARRDDVALLAARCGVPESGLLRLWNPAVADADMPAAFAFL